MDKWMTNVSYDDMELGDDMEFSSDSDLSEMFGEAGYKGRIPNECNKKRRLLSSSSESDSENIEELPDIDPRQFLWSAQNLAAKVFDFDENLPGIKANIDDKSSILEIFQLFISENMVEHIVRESNAYYTTKTISSKHSRLLAWKNTTVTEMYRFFALSMLMSRVKKVSIEEYWSTDELLRTESFPRIMTKDRYKSLLQMLHFHDNNETTNQDVLIKIRSIIDKLRNSFSRAFYPYKYLCIDESLLLFKGRCFFKQYIPSKRSRFGIKSFVICDCHTGYIQDFIVYCGARTDITNNNLAEIGKSGNIVMTLMEPYLNKGHVLVTDNWYSSPALFSLLHHNRTHAFGTVKKNRRGMPNISNKLCKGEVAFKSTDKLLALKWMDKREVLMLSSYHSAEFIETKRNDVKTGRPILKPTVVVDYNRVMGAVDKTDMILNSINTIRKTLKWYKKLFFHMVDLSIYNTFILYKITSKKNITFAKFHLRLIREILLKYSNTNICNNKSGGQTASKDDMLRLISTHFPSKYINPTGKRRNGRRKCVVCRKHKKRTETQFECKECKVGLCIEPCFKLYHTKEHY
ncbi:piggyBac transposable element-derived protein 4-like [Neodiprion virginianus]|uniref:PiggyBac transposable element-derived protein 4-like n=1 Tax=Neodiprion lecontei TaxID=441921 RepID=A0ABM3FK07_NEOLC|nr:piggyBac transposable element-derived protein 4-like [Neodiprion lecontei]XP_046606574.1 piggyBac transposable element-derived protein 4-like [Neodiprion virginianus]